MTVPFADFDIALMPEDFAGFDNAIADVEDTCSTQHVDLNQGADMGKTSAGGVSFNLDGYITDTGTDWWFSGDISLGDDLFEFHDRPGRSWDNEIANQVGKLLPGKAFTIHFEGSRHVDDSGDYSD